MKKLALFLAILLAVEGIGLGAWAEAPAWMDSGNNAAIRQTMADVRIVSSGTKSNRITVSKTVFKLNASAKKQTFSLKASCLGGAKMTYKSSASAVKVDKKGKVTISAGFVGSAKITITAEKTGIYRTAKKTVTVKTERISNPFAVSGKTYEYTPSERSISLKKTASGSAKITYKVSDSRVKVKNNVLKLPASYSGKFTVTAASAQKGIYKKTTKKFTVTVKQPPVAPTDTPEVTAVPTTEPTTEPTSAPTAAPTAQPTTEATAVPTADPTVKPTTAPTAAPTAQPTTEATVVPTADPTAKPTTAPTAAPTAQPTTEATAVPTAGPTVKPTTAPTAVPTAQPQPTTEATIVPTAGPTAAPTATPKPTATAAPTAAPTATPTAAPTATPKPTATPTVAPTATAKPTATPTAAPTATPKPTATPTAAPTATPKPTETPTPEPTATPTPKPTATPTINPTVYRAYVVGEKNYSPVLMGCDNDAREMAAMLNTLDDDYQVTLKLDQTKAEIMSGIQNTFSGADEDDISLFYYSGHGASSTGALVPLDHMGITPAELASALGAVPGKVIVILDCCYSGMAIASGRSSASSFNSKVVQAFSAAPPIRNRWTNVMPSSGELRTEKFMVITACSQWETSQSIAVVDDQNNRFDFGLFTNNLLQGCGWDENARTACRAGADEDGNLEVTLNEAYTYAYSNVNQSVIEFNKQIEEYNASCGEKDKLSFLTEQSVQVYPANSSVPLFHLKR